MIPVGELIWISAQPVIRLFLCAAAGFTITKVGLLTATAARGTGQIYVNITIPSLLFSRIVSAPISSNIGAVGLLIFIALLYQAIGIVMSCTVKQIFWVPHRFRYGILVAGGWGNIADIPMAIIMNLAASAPFRGESDQNLAIAYISVFSFIANLTLFSFGGISWIAMDFQGPDVADEDIQEQLKIKQKCLGAAIERFAALFKRILCQSPSQRENSIHDDEKAMSPSTSPLAISPPDVCQDLASDSEAAIAMPHATIKLEKTKSGTEHATPFRLLARIVFNFLQSLTMPRLLAIILGFIVSIVPELKALFVPDIPGVHMPPAPDGQPPLAIILNTMTFIGGASVPLGLMILGSTLARIKIHSRHSRSLPLGAISALVIGRMVIMPILGVLIIQGLTQAGLIDAKDKILQFVAIFTSCVPSATTQVVMTQIYSGTDEAVQYVTVFLIPQYMVVFFSMTGLIIYTLHVLFG